MTLQRSNQNERHDLYFRSADRLRAQGCANALSREGLSVVMSCEREALLDHYVEMTLQEITKVAPDCLVEAYFPESTESLMARFNDILSRSSVQDALKPAAADTPVRVWVIHDAPSVATQELQLLARLIHNFPGAKVRALLLSTQRGAQDSLTVFVRRLLRWDIDLPTAAQVEAALENARFEGRERSVRQLLSVSGLLPGQHLAAPAAALMADAEAAITSHDLVADDAQPDIRTTHRPHSGSSRLSWAQRWASRMPSRLQTWRRWWPQRAAGKSPAAAWSRIRWRKPSDRMQGALVVGLALMALSTVLTFWMQPESFKSAGSVSTKPTRATVSNNAAAGMRPVALRMDAQ